MFLIDDAFFPIMSPQ